MNPLTNVRNVTKLNEQDIKNGRFDHNLTWHAQYKDSAYIFVGGLPYDLTEGDVLCVFSQYGEIVNINLVRDKKTGKFKGYGFLCYEDQRSTILVVDNFNGIKLGGRTIRVDHVGEYRVPKGDEKDESGKYKDKIETGCAPRTPSPEPSDDESSLVYKPEKKKKKKDKDKKKKKKKKKSDSLQEESESDTDTKYKNKVQKSEKERSHRDDSYSGKHFERQDKKEKKSIGEYDTRIRKDRYSDDDDYHKRDKYDHNGRRVKDNRERHSPLSRKRRRSRSNSLDRSRR